jgi:CheY-like chemotaxis protein
MKATFLLGRMGVHRKAAQVSHMPTDLHRAARTSTVRLEALAPLVLIADADRVSRDVREAQLRAAGLRVSVARTGFEAIVKASCQVPDVILLADSLNDLEAMETGRLLATCPMTQHIPILRLLRAGRLPQRVLTRLRRVAA